MARRLDRGRIITEALALVDEQGLDRLSMRALAARLGVDPMAAYRHVPNKDALLDGVVEAVMAEIDLDPGTGEWRDRLRALCHRLREGLLRHPNALPLLSTRVWGTGASLDIIEQGLDLGADAGLDPHEAALAVNATALFLVALSQAQTADTPRLPPLDPASHPRLATLMAAGQGPGYDQLFDWWVEGLVARVEGAREAAG